MHANQILLKQSMAILASFLEFLKPCNLVQLLWNKLLLYKYIHEEEVRTNQNLQACQSFLQLWSYHSNILISIVCCQFWFKKKIKNQMPFAILSPNAQLSTEDCPNTWLPKTFTSVELDVALHENNKTEQKSSHFTWF